jgi:hypothetical protein
MFGNTSSLKKVKLHSILYGPPKLIKTIPGSENLLLDSASMVSSSSLTNLISIIEILT